MAEISFVVDKLYVYDFFLEFYYRPGDQQDRKRVRGVLGGSDLDKAVAPLESGVITPVGKVLFPGKYLLRLEGLSGNPVYASIKTDFVIGMDRFKTSIS